MNIRWIREIPQIVLVLAMWVLAAVTWSSAPERIPIHWNLQGEVDGYGGKFTGLLLLPIMAVVIYLLLLLLPRLDPGRANYAAFQGAYGIIRLTVMVILAAICFITHMVMRGQSVRMETVVPMLIAVMFIVMGSVLGKIRPNWFVGVRTPWTLSSKLSWTKTHRLAGWLFIGTGILSLVGSCIHPQAAFITMMAGAFSSVIAMFVYSYVVWRRDPDKVAPAGTTPADDGDSGA